VFLDVQTISFFETHGIGVHFIYPIISTESYKSYRKL
jgi:hypothetical protein